MVLVTVSLSASPSLRVFGTYLYLISLLKYENYQLKRIAAAANYKILDDCKSINKVNKNSKQVCIVPINYLNKSMSRSSPLITFR